ncbi:MAG TPA: hypothetical protein VMU83_15970 [Hanamia sp.]|nr:hypothetical protein [Hanamia sp.]
MGDNIYIKRIKEMSFLINEPLFSLETHNKFKMEIGVFLSFAIEKNLVILLTRVFYHYEDAPPDQIMVDSTVQNVFEIEDLKRFIVEGNGIKFPPSLITSLVSLSISHTRALMAQRIIGTVYQNNIMGIVNADELTRHFFPKMFNEEEKEPKKEDKKPKIKFGKNPPSKNSY